MQQNFKYKKIDIRQNDYDNIKKSDLYNGLDDLKYIFALLCDVLEKDYDITISASSTQDLIKLDITSTWENAVEDHYTLHREDIETQKES